jgi:hypothetical protein
MPRSSCDYCCNPVEFANDNYSFKAAVLQIMCNMNAAIESGGGGGGGTAIGPTGPTTTGNLSAGVAAQYNFAAWQNKVQIWATPELPGRIYGKWNSATASATDWDFYVDPGNIFTFTGTPVNSVALFNASAATYGTHFMIEAYIQSGSIFSPAVGIGPDAPVVTGNLTAITARQFTFAQAEGMVEVWTTPELPARIYGKWNSATASATSWDFYLDAGENLSFSDQLITSVALYSALGATYLTHFNLVGFHN